MAACYILCDMLDAVFTLAGSHHIVHPNQVLHRQRAERSQRFAMQLRRRAGGTLYPLSTGALEEVSQTSLQRVDTSASFRTAASGSTSFLSVEQYSSLLTRPRMPSVANVKTPQPVSGSMNTAHSLQSMPSLYHSSQVSAQHSAQQQLYEHPGGMPGVRMQPPPHVAVYPQSPEASQLASPEIMHEEIQESAVEKLLADMQLQVGSNEFAHHK
jgi:hypothetical protein